MKQSERIEIIRQAHKKVLEEQGAFISQLLPSTKEDVEDEFEHLDSIDHEKPIDFDNDENEVDMENISPSMRELYS
jgi:hypothetical protein